MGASRLKEEEIAQIKIRGFHMTEVIGVRFKNGGKQYYFDPCGQIVAPGQGVIIDTVRGPEYGECVMGNTQITDEQLPHTPLRPMLRIATEQDRERNIYNKEKEQRAFQICQEKILKHGLDMKLVEVEYNLEGNKILFFFTSDGRVDFRALVRDLASVFHARIELRQIGVRDEAKMLGGLGICGKPFCCSSFLNKFQPVSIKMAKTQNLSLNPTKISGTCGRLMCCLKYEQDAYEDAVKRMPKIESFVETPDGAGTVKQINLLRETVQVQLEEQPESPRVYHNCEIRIVRNGRGKRPEGYIPPPPKELEKLRQVTPPPETEEYHFAVNMDQFMVQPEQPEKHINPPHEHKNHPSHHRSGSNKPGRSTKAVKPAKSPKTKPQNPRPRPEKLTAQNSRFPVDAVEKKTNKNRRRPYSPHSNRHHKPPESGTKQ